METDVDTRPCPTTVLGIVSNELHFLIAREQQRAICFRMNSGSLIIFTSMLQFLSWDSGLIALS